MIRRRGVTTPVFWGSFLGILIGSVIAGLSYLGLIGPELRFTDKEASVNPRPVMVIFCCLLCIRYYASIIFLTYDDTTSPRVLQLEPRARQTIFLIQLLLIIGCSLNIALLPLYGATAAILVIIVQSTLIIEYWALLWRVLLIEDPQARFRVVVALGDLAILISAAIFFVWENNWFDYDETGAGMCMGAIIIVFIAECLTTYFDSFRSFLRDTLTDLGFFKRKKEATVSTKFK
jgi:hypothetical protein